MSQFQKDLIIVVAATLGVIAVIVAATSFGKSGKQEHSDYTSTVVEAIEQQNETESEELYSDLGEDYGDYPANTEAESVAESGSESGLTDYSEWVCTTRLTDADVSGMPKSELRILRNTIYARHGYIFKSADLREHFSKFNWYVPSTSAVDDLSSIEQHNVALIQRYE